MAKKWMAEVLAEWVPGLSMPTGVKPSRCYHVNDFDIKTVTEEFRECHSRISARLGRDLILWEPEVARSATKLADPLSILITQGDDDRICPPEFSGEMFHTIPAEDKTFLLLKAVRHEPLREPDNQEFLESVRVWLESKS
jgi:alpha-beta hydrolase superfamily lysophospholipase